jgi:hypothetical protein
MALTPYLEARAACLARLIGLSSDGTDGRAPEGF